MDAQIRADLDGLLSSDGAVRYAAINAILSLTEQPVDWAYDVWDELLANLRHKDNHVRSIAAQVLANLARSDPAGRMLTDFDALMAGTRDPMFVTARHTLQSAWKVGAAGQPQRALVVERFAGRFVDCAPEKNCTLIRYDIMQGLRQLYDATHDEAIKTRALALIDTEPDAKYQKKYAGVWKGT
jgi:hypothetical protein